MLMRELQNAHQTLTRGAPNFGSVTKAGIIGSRFYSLDPRQRKEERHIEDVFPVAALSPSTWPPLLVRISL
jgi:hypothetical protein